MRQRLNSAAEGWVQTLSIAKIFMELSSRMLAKKLHPGTEAGWAARGVLSNAMVPGRVSTMAVICTDPLEMNSLKNKQPVLFPAGNPSLWTNKTALG